MKIINEKIENIQGNNEDIFFYNKNEVYEILKKLGKDLIIIGNLKTNVFKYPKEIVDFLGITSQIVRNPLEDWKKIILEEDWNKFCEAKEKCLSGEEPFIQIDFRIKDKENKIVWLKGVGGIKKDKKNIPSTFVGTISLHDDNKIDPITKLLTVNECFKSLEKRIKSSSNKKLSFIILGINNFKRINEFYGRIVGDMVLEKMAQIIKDNLPKNGEVYRLDGTNFGIIIDDISNIDIEKLHTNIKIQFAKEVSNNYKDILTISAGVATYPENGGTFQEIYQHSKYARGYSKHNAVSLAFFNQKLFNLREKYLKLLSQLKRDIENGFNNFSLAFQPQIVSKTKEIKGVEALLRWKNEEYGNISPMEFIPILEENNLMIIV